MMLDTKLEPAVAKDMLRGAADPLWSEFRLGYVTLDSWFQSSVSCKLICPHELNTVCGSDSPWRKHGRASH